MNGRWAILNLIMTCISRRCKSIFAIAGLLTYSFFVTPSQFSNQWPYVTNFPFGKNLQQRVLFRICTGFPFNPSRTIRFSRNYNGAKI